MTPLSWSASTGAALVGVLALGGCAGDSEADGSSSSSTASPRVPSSSSTSGSRSGTSSGSASPSSSTSTGADGEGELPEEAREKTKKGAAAFGKHYYISVGKTAETANPQVMAGLSTDSCKVCKAVIDEAKKYQSRGWRVDRQAHTISEVAATKRPDEGYKVTMVVDVEKHYRLDSKGARTATIKPTRYRLTEHVVWHDGGWRVADWVISDV